MPLVLQAFNWVHGVYLGATLGSETTAAATGQVGVVRRDPMAMLPFCGYDMGTYFSHWLDMADRIPALPKIFQVNWFRKGEDGRYLWPGFGDNMRVLKWIIDRAHGRAGARETEFGWVPKQNDFDLSGVAVPLEDVDEAQSIDPAAWRAELADQEAFFKKHAATMPKEIVLQRDLLIARMERDKRLNPEI